MDNTGTNLENQQPVKNPPKMGRQPSFLQAGLLIVVISATILYGVVGLHVAPHVPIFISLTLALAMGLYLKYPWEALEDGVLKGITGGLIPILLMLLIGIIIGTWIACGTIPYLIYLGIKIISPQWFFVSALLTCSVISLSTGSSWTSAGTLGVAFMGIGHAIGMPPAMTAGAVVCGAVLGDKISPFSETVLFVAGVTEVPVYDHVRSMLWTTLPAFFIGGVIFAVLGFTHAPENADLERINVISDTLASSFNFNPLLLLLPVILIISVVKQVPSLLGVGIGAVMGMVFAVIFQGASLPDVMQYAHYGFKSATGVDFVDSMLSKGGLNSMMYTISLVILALSMGGVLERTGMLKTVLETLSRLVNNVVGLVSTTLASVLALEFIMADTYLPMLLGGRTFKPAFDKLKLNTRVLSRSLADTGTTGAWMVPWSECGVFATATLGIAVLDYLPYYFLGWVTPIVAVTLAATGIGIFYTDGRKKAKERDLEAATEEAG